MYLSHIDVSLLLFLPPFPSLQEEINRMLLKQMRHPNKNRRTTTVIIADYIILYIKSLNIILELINEVSKVAGHKINIQKSAAFGYTNKKPLSDN